MANAAAQHVVTILVAEPEQTVRELARASVPSGWRVVEAESGAEALRLVEAEAPDVVVLGLPLPDADGLQLCRELERRSPRGPIVPVLVLGGADGRGPADEALAAGADDVLAKPVSARDLSLRIRALERLREHELLAHDQEDALSALVAHDLRNPLSATAGILGMLRKDVSDAGLREDLETAFTGVTRAREILEDVLRVRLLETQAIRPSPCECDLAELARAAARTHAAAAAEQGVDLVVPAPPGPAVSLDPDLVRRAVENLVANSIRYARRGSAVEVSASLAGGVGVVQVADRGPAVPDALKRTVFEKYGSVIAARESARRGQGLALHLVWLVARRHGGTIEALDREGGGNAFRLVLGTPRAAR